MCRGKRFHITIHPDDLEDHKSEYARLIDGLAKLDDPDFDLNLPDPQEELEEWILQPVRPMFSKLVPEQPPTPQKVTVAECFYPPTFFFTLKSICGILTAVRTEDDIEDAKYWIPRMEIAPDLFKPGLRIVRPHDLEVVWDPELQDGPSATRVSLGSNDQYFLKHTVHGANEPIRREIETLHRLQDLGVSETNRVPKLHGFVQYEEEDRISGLLLTYIDARGTLDSVVRFKDPSEELKKKWMDQIEAMLEAIHQASIVWGDAKTDNVLIDQEDNAWIIDFGGSYTPGWVDKDKLETVEGDLQGLLAIKRFLGFGTQGQPEPSEGAEVVCNGTTSC
ncbi:MAG: hypothetical protein Q9170_002264 [Blastenia crenularia]